DALLMGVFIALSFGIKLSVAPILVPIAAGVAYRVFGGRVRRSTAERSEDAERVGVGAASASHPERSEGSAPSRTQGADSSLRSEWESAQPVPPSAPSATSAVQPSFSSHVTKTLGQMAIAGVLAFALYAIMSPYALLDFKQLVSDHLFETRIAQT